MESRVDLFARIRRDARVEGLSVRALAVRHGVHRRTVRQALTSASPPARKPRQGVSRRLEPVKAAIDAMLVEDTTAPRSNALLPVGSSPASSMSMARRSCPIRRSGTMFGFVVLRSTSRQAAGSRSSFRRSTRLVLRRRWTSARCGSC